ncbi:hypothetical protein AW19_4150 (plasmid) [Yersinia frederiksenii Y225]|nr:hypothetical protein AW19_4150 [Yersinia frederiksenii Y225]
MNFIILNNSGNVGKSTLTQKMFSPRIENSAIISIETINSDGTENKKYTADDYAKIFNDLLAEGDKNYIIDIGASNIENFYIQMEEHEGLTNAFVDYFIIPVTPVQKQQIDSINTVLALQQNGIENDKIKFVFNLTSKKSPIEEQCSYFFEKIADLGFNFDGEKSVVYETGFFDTLKDNDIMYEAVEQDTIDHKAELKTVTSNDEKVALRKAMVYRAAYNSFHKNLDLAFESLKLEIL